jgi:hypothetical protein
MRVEFPQGLPEGCTEWLNKHVGKGNTTVNISRTDSPDYDWFYERVQTLDEQTNKFDPRDTRNLGLYVPSITVKDPKLAAWFILRWS